LTSPIGAALGDSSDGASTMALGHAQEWVPDDGWPMVEKLMSPMLEG
jgi:hypothetical protein